MLELLMLICWMLVVVAVVSGDLIPSTRLFGARNMVPGNKFYKLTYCIRF